MQQASRPSQTRHHEDGSACPGQSVLGLCGNLKKNKKKKKLDEAHMAVKMAAQPRPMRSMSSRRVLT